MKRREYESTTADENVGTAERAQNENRGDDKPKKEVDKYLVNIMINNVAGLGILTEKAGMILQWTEEKGVDVF